MEKDHKKRRTQQAARREWICFLLTYPWIPSGCMVWIMFAAFLLGCIARYMFSR